MCTACQINIDRTDEFAEKLLAMYTGGSLATMISIGHRTGLFDTMTNLRSSTSTEIAQAAGLNERYVREWLGAMTTGGIVECNPEGTHFSLPPEHAACLTRSNIAENMAIFAQFIPMLGTVEDQIVDCFKQGGGVPYSEFKRFHDVMAEESGQTVVSVLIDKILPIVPGIVEDLENGTEFLDIGCGCGRALNLLARTFPNSRFRGYDLSEEAIAKARTEAETYGTTNVEFQVRDLSTFHEDAEEGAYDYITAFDAIHDQARPDNVLAGIRRALKPDGTFLMQDISSSSNVVNNVENPLAPFLYTISTMHCMTVSLAQNGMGLGTVWGREKAETMLREAGFQNVQITNLEHDIMNDYYVVT